MKCLLTTVFILFTVFSISPAQESISTSDEIRALNRKLVGAIWDRNIDELDRILADDFVSTTGDRSTKKSEVIKGIYTAPSLRGDISYSVDRITVSTSEDKVVSTARLTVRDDVDGTELGSQDYTSTWAMRQGRWRIIEFKASPKVIPSATNLRDQSRTSSNLSALRAAAAPNVRCGILNKTDCKCSTGQVIQCVCEACGDSIFDLLCERCNCKCGCDNYVCENSFRQCNPDAPGVEIACHGRCVNIGCGYPLRRPRHPSRQLPNPPTQLSNPNAVLKIAPREKVRLVALFPMEYTELTVDGEGADLLWKPFGAFGGWRELDFDNNTDNEIPLRVSATSEKGKTIGSNGGGVANNDLGLLGWGYEEQGGDNGTFIPHKALLLTIRRANAVDIPIQIPEGTIEVDPRTTMKFLAVFPSAGPIKLQLRGQREGEEAFDIWETPLDTRVSWSLEWRNSSNKKAIITVSAFALNGQQKSQIEYGQQNYSQGSLSILGFGYSKGGQRQSPYRVVLVATPVGFN